MKKLLLLSAGLMFSILLSAQTQQGYVKTKGRMVNGNYVPGQGLKGATISIKGKTTVLVNADDGAFSFPIPEKTFVVQRVQKNGFQLVDADMIKKPFNYSSNPIYLVMETPEQQMQDQLDSERKIRRTLMKQLQQKEDEIEGLKVQGKITQAQYQETMQKLYSDQENNEKLIAEMAKHYAQIDYDQMDELNQRISDAILNGRLTEADSMLRSKGSMSSRVAEIRKEQQTEAQRETEIAQEQKNLDDAKAGTQMKLERIAEDCHMYFDLCKLNMEWDSAAYYIALRAELDTANAEWLFDAAYYFQEQNNFSQAESFYSKCLKICQLLADGDPQAYGPNLAATQNNLAVLYSRTQRLTESESMHLQALEIYQRLASDDPQTYEPDLAWTQSDLAVLYANTQRLTESERLYLQAVDTYRRLANSDPQTYQPNLASTLCNLANLYKYTQRYTESERLFMEAIEIYQKLVDDNPQVYKPKLSWAMGLLAVLYSDLQRYTESEKVLLEVLEIHKLLANDNPQAWEPSLAIALNDLASLYSRIQRLSESEKMYLESLEIHQRLADNNPQVYEPNLATTLNNLADIYENTQRFIESEKMYIDALAIRRRLAANNPQAFEPALAVTLNNLAILYFSTERLVESEKMFVEALEIRRRLADANPQTFNPSLAITLHNLAVLYFDTQHFKESESMFEEAVKVYRQLANDNPQAYKADLASTLCYFGALKFVEGQYETATKHFEEALSIDPSQYWINPYLAISLLIQGKYTKAETVYRQNKNELKDVFLQDLDHYEAAGIIPEKRKGDVERIRKMLTE